MKSKMKIGVIALAVVVLGVVSVRAAESQLTRYSNYSVSSGQSSLANGLSAAYNNAKATAYVNSVTGGTHKTYFRAYRYDNNRNSYILKAYIDVDLQLGNTTYYLGEVTAGTWRLCNYAYNPLSGTNYTGWSGSLTYYTYS